MRRFWQIALAALACMSCGKGGTETQPLPAAHSPGLAQPNFSGIRPGTPICVVSGFRSSLSADLRGPPVHEVAEDMIGQCNVIVHFNQELRTGWRLDPTTSTLNSEKCISDVVRTADGSTRSVTYAIKSQQRSADNCMLRVLIARAGHPEILTLKDSDLSAGGRSPEQVLRERWAKVGSVAH